MLIHTTNGRRLTALAALAVCLATTLPAPPAAAGMKSWTVRVLQVSDGDTFYIDTNGDGRQDDTVRMAGLNTPEGHMKGGRFQGQCHGAQAFRRLEGLIEGKRVVLRANSYNSMGSGGRLLRYVDTIGGTDLAALLLREGLAVPYPSNIEPARNSLYIRLAKEAATAGRVIWSKKGCSYGPKQNVKIRVLTQWDAQGNDENNLHGEYVRLENPSSRAFSLRNWVLRDSASMYYYFSDTAKIPARGSLTVHSGSRSAYGTARHRHISWGAGDRCKPAAVCGSKSLFGDSHLDNGQVVGDGAYLYDPHGDLRYWQGYPCLGTCSHPAQGKLRLSWDNSRLDWVKVHNIHTAPVTLKGLVLDSPDSSGQLHRTAWSYEVKRVTIPAGGSLMVHTGTGTASIDRLVQFWGAKDHIFADNDDGVRLRTMDVRIIHQLKW